MREGTPTLPMLIKICGLRTQEHMRVAALAGADMLGLVFAPSRRQVSIAEAAHLVAALRAGPPPYPRLVGLFVNRTPAFIQEAAEHLDLDLVQLSGTEPVSDATAIKRPIIKTVRLDGSVDETAWLELAEREAEGGSVTLLIDAHVPGHYGGTGALADWSQARELAARVPVLLAGGLTPGNVAAAIAAVQPYGVDVSSGVETDGGKDSAKIEAFIAAARAS